MRALDSRATEEFGIPSLLLMENAGLGIAELAASEISSGKIVVVAGKGNNGGDGFVAARHLHNRGFAVHILLLSDPKMLQGDATLNFDIVSRMKIPCETFNDAKEHLGEASLIIDAIFGIGLKKPLEGPYADAVNVINESRKPVLAIDVPSGIDADTGDVRGAAIKATVTGTLGLPKNGLFRGAGALHAGKIAVVDIGLPRQVIS